ncbi:MAG: restriction endonuclease subunit S, partial [Planctomycetia bacterium]|nr:restriction endonuclease subunit S [Planctomycetia bacterium]
MAKIKKISDSISLADRLQSALVPEEKQLYTIPKNWVWAYLLNGIVTCLDSFRKPVNTAERVKRTGDIPYYGATG